MKFEVYICLIELELTNNMNEEEALQFAIVASLAFKDEDDAIRAERAEINAVTAAIIQNTENENRNLKPLIDTLLLKNQELERQNEILLLENSMLKHDKISRERQLEAIFFAYPQQI